jgi:hypothetical protein
MLVDERCGRAAALRHIIVMDELAGLAKAEIEKVKSVLTAPVLTYRPMRSNTFVDVPNNMMMIGTSNLSLGEIVRDHTGMRRFYEMPGNVDKAHWRAINALDYAALWAGAVDERADDGRSPMEMAGDTLPEAVHAVQTRQGDITASDMVLTWTVSRCWVGAVEPSSADSGSGATATGDGEGITGGPLGALYASFRSYCEDAGEKNIPPRRAFTVAMRRLGWAAHKVGPRDGRHTIWTAPPCGRGGGGAADEDTGDGE